MTETPAELRETERRVLGNLPAYRTSEGHEAAIAEALEYGTITTPDDWPTSRTLDDLTARLAKDRHCVILASDADAVEAILGDLVARGLAEQSGDQYAMTEAGLAALTA